MDLELLFFCINFYKFFRQKFVVIDVAAAAAAFYLFCYFYFYFTELCVFFLEYVKLLFVCSF